MLNYPGQQYPAAPDLRIVSVGDTILRWHWPARYELAVVNRTSATGIRIGGKWFYRATGRQYRGEPDPVHAVVKAAGADCPYCRSMRVLVVNGSSRGRYCRDCGRWFSQFDVKTGEEEGE